jgi:four helix bundle protein
MKTRFRFQKLKVWNDARAMNRRLYGLTRKFPRDERFGMTAQLRSASVSVSSNIAEGSGRNSDKDFAHFLELLYGSLMEVASLLYLATDETYLTDAVTETGLDYIESLGRQIVALNNSLGVKTSKTPFVRSGPRPSTFDPRPNGPNA